MCRPTMPRGPLLLCALAAFLARPGVVAFLLPAWIGTSTGSPATPCTWGST